MKHRTAATCTMEPRRSLPSTVGCTSPRSDAVVDSSSGARPTCYRSRADPQSNYSVRFGNSVATPRALRSAARLVAAHPTRQESILRSPADDHSRKQTEGDRHGERRIRIRVNGFIRAFRATRHFASRVLIKTREPFLAGVEAGAQRCNRAGGACSGNVVAEDLLRFNHESTEFFENFLRGFEPRCPFGSSWHDVCWMLCFASRGDRWPRSEVKWAGAATPQSVDRAQFRGTAA